MKIQEQIAAFEAKRTTAEARQIELLTKSGASGETLDEAEGQEHDSLSNEIATINKHIGRLKATEALMVAKGVNVNGTGGTGADDGNGAGGRSAGVRVGNVLSVKSNLPPGVEFARYVKCLGAAHGSRSEALEYAKAHYSDMPRLGTVLKAAVAAGTTTDPTWASTLVDYQHFAGDFVEYLRPMTILGKFGTNGVPALFKVPFNIQVPAQTSGGAGYWVGEGQPKPLTKFDFANITLRWAKVANIAVLSEELLRFSSPSADILVRNALAAALLERIDIDFVNPAKAPVANVSPASITYGVVPVQSSGNDSDAIRSDIARLMASFITANLTPSNGVWIMSATSALRLSLMRNSLGQKEFDGITMMGGTFEGLPVIVSQYVPTSVSGGGVVILANASDIYLSDDGGVTIDASREASLQMLDNPTNESAGPTATTMVSMFQTNSVAVRAERWINWAKRRSAAVAYLDNVHWGE